MTIEKFNAKNENGEIITIIKKQDEVEVKTSDGKSTIRKKLAECKTSEGIRVNVKDEKYYLITDKNYETPYTRIE